jgi:PAS domain S-box-containing protein
LIGFLRLWRVIILVIFASLLSVPVHAQAQSALGSKNILVVHSFEANVPVFTGTDKGLSTILESGGISSLNQYFESLDLRRNPGLEHRKLLIEQMRLRYGHRKLDLIVTMYPEALEFVLKDGRDIFPHVPILALYLPEGFELPKTDRRIIGHSAKTDIIGTLEIALKLVPGARHVYVVSGAHEVDRMIEDRARRELNKWETRLDFHYLGTMSFEDMLATISTAPPHSLVLALVLSQDVTGRSFTSLRVTQQLSEVSRAPIFGLLDAALGHGITGGSLINFESIGAKAGELVLDILRGTPTPHNIPEFMDAPPVPMFDWRQLRRWNLSVNALPTGSIVINRELTLWDFKYYVLGGLALCLAQSLLIAGLLLQRRRRRTAEQSLRQRTEELDQFFNVNLDLLCIANTDGYFLRVNPAMERVLGYAREELTDRPFFDFVHPDDVNRTREAVAALRSQQEVFLFGNRYRCKDGTYRWLEWSSAPAGKQIYSAARDVTERNQMQSKIQNAAEEWQTTFDSIQDLVMILDPEFKLVRVNEATLSFFKHPSERVLGKRCHDLMHGTTEPVQACPLTKMLKTKAHEETELYDGKRDAWFHISVDPVFDDRGEILRVIHTVKDVTERRRAEKEAFDARRELLRMDRLSRMGELTASLAHELNQPLTAILSNAQAALRFLQSEKPDLKELREILQDITSDDKRAGNVIRSLRAMMKQEERGKERLSINEMAGDVVSLFHSEAVLRNVVVETDFAEPLPFIFADKIQLQQVVLNLMMNATEAMDRESPERRKILLKTRRTGDGAIQVAVRDYGPGIEEEKLGLIFQPFFTTKGAGLGMGLSFSRSIIEAHGGRLWAENNRDRGATFFFELPVVK